MLASVLTATKILFWILLIILILRFVKRPKKKKSQMSLFKTLRPKRSGLQVIDLKKQNYRMLSDVVNADTDYSESGIKMTTKYVDDKSLPNVYVLRFNGMRDPFASGVQSLRREIDAILQLKEKPDYVFLHVNSPGGTVIGYGLCTSQLIRLKNAGIKIWGFTDQVAASGGYMILSVCDRIFASTYTILGSVGVVNESPNFYKLLEKVGVSFVSLTSGDKKRTLTPFTDPNSEQFKEGKEHTLNKLTDVHQKFVSLVANHRPSINIDIVKEADTFYADEALELGLIDEIKLIDDALIEKYQTHNVYELSYQRQQAGLAKYFSLAAKSLVQAFHTYLK